MAMLRKLKQQVSIAVNAVSSNETNERLMNDNASEGFLCPLCMQIFSSPEELKLHFNGHLVSQSDAVNSVTTEPFSTENGFINEPFIMELELKELRSSLLDEKHYSSELKKELDRLSAIIAKQNKVAEGEMPYLLQQVQMLEAGKALVTQRLLETEKELNAATRLIESSRVEKDGIVTKLGEVSAKVTKLTEEIEDKQAEKTLLGDELVRYRKEISNLEEQIQNLVAQLDQRPSEDDVRVLRQELVHAQQLMNKMTLEKEEEIAEHLATICHLNKDNQQLEQKCSVVDEIMSESKNTTRCVEEYQEKTKILTKKLNEALAKISQMENLLEESRREMIHSNALNESNNTKLTELNIRFDQMDAEKILYKEDIKRLEEVHEREMHEHSQALDNVSKLQLISVKDDLIEEVGNLKDLLENEKKLSAELKLVNDRKDVIIIEMQQQIETLMKKIDIQEGKIEYLSNEVQIVEELKLAEHSMKLVQKIAEEDDVNLAMKRMQEENTKLKDYIKEMNILNKQLKEDNEELANKEQFSEKLALEKEKLRTVGETSNKARHKYAVAEDDVKWKLQKIIDEKDCCIEEKENVIIKERTEIQEVVQKLRAVEEKAKFLDDQLNESRWINEVANDEKVLLLQSLDEKNVLLAALGKNVKNMEEKINFLQDEIAENKVGKMESEKTEIELRNLIDEKAKEIAQLLDEAKKMKEINSEHEINIENLMSKIISLEAEMNLSKKEKNELHEQVHSFFSQLSTLGERSRTLERNVEMAVCEKEKERVAREEVEQRLHKCSAARENENNENRKRIADLTEKIAELEEQLSSATQEIESYSKIINEKLSMLSEVERKLELSEIKQNELLQRIECIKNELNEKTDLLNSAEQAKNRFEKEINSKKMEVDKLTSCYAEKEGMWKQEKNNFEKQIEDLNYSSQMEKKDKEEKLKLATALLNEKVDENKELMNLCEGRKHEIEKLSKIIAEKEVELQILTKNFEENQALLADKESKYFELEAKAAKWLEERKAFKQRCLKSESDLDFERDRAAENKRRFDDAISAMHDLGRANQSLQMDISKHFNRKWLDDSEAVNCNLCTKLFSLTVRKHHCRHCGLIFCGNCTQHTAEVPSHKNPVRVCSICYEEITNR